VNLQAGEYWKHYKNSFTSVILTSSGTIGTYTVASGRSYEAESGSLAGGARLLSNSNFSGGNVVGYLGKGGSVTINNVQGNGRGQWVSLYVANGDSSFRNTTIR
jgi:hypothetical protein